MLTVEEAIKMLQSLPKEDHKKVLCFSDGKSAFLYPVEKIERVDNATIAVPTGGWIHSQDVIIAY